MSKELTALEEKLHDLSYVLSSREINELGHLCFEHSNSGCPLNAFFNDIRFNDSKTYDKNQAYKDLWLIALIVLGKKKSLKALEIIKKKGVNLYKLKICDSVEEYNKLCNSALLLNQEEFDLLKEVLL